MRAASASSPRSGTTASGTTSSARRSSARSPDALESLSHRGGAAMPLSIYQLAVPPIVKALTTQRAVLEKAKAHAAARKIDESAFISARLCPDMLPLSFQVQVACDIGRAAVARVAGLEPPKYEDNETTFDQLVARID